MAIDLDKARAARRAEIGECPTIILDGESYSLPVEMPYEVLESLGGLRGGEEEAAAALIFMTQALLGPQYEAIKSKLSVDDLKFLIEGAMAEYGVESPLDSSAP